MDFKNNMALLETLVDDYYRNQIGFDEYRQQRNQILQALDQELNGVTAINETKDLQSESLLDKALSFLKIDSAHKIN